MQTQKQLIQMLETFALSEPKINAVYQGYSPEDKNHTIYYFLVDGPFNPELTDKISELSYEIKDADLSEWPCTIKQVENYPFLEDCIWKKE